MTALNFQETPMVSTLGNKILTSPAGWVTTGIHIINLNKQVDEAEAIFDRNLPMAAKRTEQLINQLSEDLSLEVSVAYMRVEGNTEFHLLLLISSYDFHSSKILAARMLAEKYAKTENYDIRFVFAIESENMMNNSIKFSGYKLMHKRNPGNNNVQVN